MNIPAWSFSQLLFAISVKANTFPGVEVLYFSSLNTDSVTLQYLNITSKNIGC